MNIRHFAEAINFFRVKTFRKNKGEGNDNDQSIVYLPREVQREIVSKIANLENRKIRELHTKLFSDLYLTKFLDTLAKPFFT